MLLCPIVLQIGSISRELCGMEYVQKCELHADSNCSIYVNSIVMRNLSTRCYHRTTTTKTFWTATFMVCIARSKKNDVGYIEKLYIHNYIICYLYTFYMYTIQHTLLFIINLLCSSQWSYWCLVFLFSRFSPVLSLFLSLSFFSVFQSFAYFHVSLRGHVPCTAFQWKAIRFVVAITAYVLANRCIFALALFLALSLPHASFAIIVEMLCNMVMLPLNSKLQGIHSFHQV